MPNFLDLLVVVGMMFLRIGVPALVIVALAYGLKRLDARWEREAGEFQATQADKRPAAPIRKPASQPQPSPLPFLPPAEIKDSPIQPQAPDDEAFKRYPKM